MHDIRKVIAWMAGTLASFSALAVSIRELSPALTVFEVLALRNLGGIVILGAWALATRQSIGAARPLRIHVLRNVFHFGGQTCWVYGLTVLPLATVFALEFTSPAWTMLLAVLFLGERITPARIGALVLGFIGVLVIVRPGAASFQPAALIVLASAVMFAVQLTTTKFLTGSSSTLNIMFWMNVMQLPMYVVAHLLTKGGMIWSGVGIGNLPAVLLLCVTGLTAHVCLTNAFRHGDAVTVVPIDFLRIPVVATVGALLYGEKLDLFVLVGAGISATGILWSVWDTRRRARAHALPSS